MNTIAVTTSQNIELEYDLGSVGERIVAGIIDRVIMIAYIAVVAIVIFKMGLTDSAETIGIIIALLPFSFYSLLSELLMNGQSVGKRVMKIKVISLNGEQPTFSQYLIRWLFRLIDVWLFSGIIAIIMIAVNEKRQRLGDLVAGTTLIRTKPRANFQQTLHVTVTDENYSVTYPQVTHLDDSNIQLIKEILTNISTTGNTMIAVEMMRKVEQLTGIKSQHEAVEFLQIVLKDYNYLTARQ